MFGRIKLNFIGDKQSVLTNLQKSFPVILNGRSIFKSETVFKWVYNKKEDQTRFVQKSGGNFETWHLFIRIEEKTNNTEIKMLFLTHFIAYVMVGLAFFGVGKIAIANINSPEFIFALLIPSFFIVLMCLVWTIIFNIYIVKIKTAILEAYEKQKSSLE
ncbi:hypothetical protein [Brumimicrobium mesophilum]|uniref:hypothetical protein n=1 Tax=Brumimicrobium mesophilum TaxID=392717 RepID=UPI000D144299|nr:hypothetical protein [Brumimicrobium mesophilum]